MASEAHVVYEKIDAATIVFSGIGRYTRTTINAEQDIIAMIARIENIDPKRCTFYDLQTFQQYGRDEGVFSFSRLDFEIDRTGRISEMRWREESCPEEVVSLFQSFIGNDPYQMKDGMDEIHPRRLGPNPN